MRQDLLAAARAAVEHDLLPRRLGGGQDGVSVVLGGSAVTDDADEYSGCDLLVLRSGDGDGEEPLVWCWINVRRPPFVYRYAALSLQTLRRALQEADDSALNLVRHGVVLHDPTGQLEEIWALARSLTPSVWRRKLARRYRALRQRRASLAWALRRGQPILVLDNLRLILEHSLACCYHLEGLPAPPPKWVFRGGLRTPAGRTLRAPVLDLLSSLGDLATLGGSLNLKHNRIYGHVGLIQAAVERALIHAGLPVPSLAAEAGSEPGTEEAPRAPRARSGRRSQVAGGGRGVVP